MRTSLLPAEGTFSPPTHQFVILHRNIISPPETP